LSHRYERPAIDAIASLCIGALLCGLAVLLAYESKGLLTGESAHTKVIDGVCRLMDSKDHMFRRRSRPLTMHLGPRRVLLCVSVSARKNASVEHLVAAMDELKSEIHRAHPMIKQIFIDISGDGEKKHM
jgi:divalent metal cation (Fe/Co/Zn/Cd) transporter